MKGEDGVFIYYSFYNYYPILLFKRFNKDSKKFEDILSVPYIELNKYIASTYSNWNNYNWYNYSNYNNWGYGNNYWGSGNNWNSGNNYNYIYFNSYGLKNDLIKIRDDKICFTTCSNTNDTLYIVLINIINTNNVAIRYYSIAIYKLNNYKILLEMRSHLYNNFIALAFSYCNQEKCDSDVDDEHYSAFLLFSYPNGIDSELKIKEYLFEHNEMRISNIIIDLKEKAIIENNLFGYIYYGFNFTENGCENIIHLLSYKNNEIIGLNTIIEDEKINLQFSSDSYDEMHCLFKYKHICTDPKFEDYTKYLDMNETNYGELDESNYQAQTDLYEGKIIEYNLVLEEKLSTTCEKNCELCLRYNNQYCITCRTNFTFDKDENNNKIKVCLEEASSLTQDKAEIIEEKEEEEKENKIEEEEEDKIEEEEEDRVEKEIIIIKEEEYNKEEEELKKEESYNTDFVEEEIKVEESQESEKIKLEATTIIYKENDTTEEIKSDEKSEETQANVKTCKTEEILEGKCTDGSMKNNQVGEVFNYFKDNILKNESYHGENKIIETENVIIQISTIEEQKNSLNPNVSTIDLGECENILKTENNIPEGDSLIILKTDFKSSDLSSTYVQYEVYDPNTLKKLDLGICDKVKIVVNVPVDLNNDEISLIDSLSEFGYNLYDPEDDFYNDICSTYTSANGTDMTLSDRKKEIFSTSGNKTMCQARCKFESYNKTTKKANCNCDAQNGPTEIDLTKIDFSKNSIKSSFLSTLTNSNFFVLKCYKLVINFSNFIKNKGRLIMSIILILFIFLLLIYFIKDRKTLNKFIQIILKSKMSNNKNKKIQEKSNVNKGNNKNKKIQEKSNVNKGNNKNKNLLYRQV